MQHAEVIGKSNLVVCVQHAGFAAKHSPLGARIQCQLFLGLMYIAINSASSDGAAQSIVGMSKFVAMIFLLTIDMAMS